MSLIPGEKNQIIVKPFIYGSVAISLGKKSKEKLTHKWCVYVRGVNNENISNFVKSVQFTLHTTFPNNIRVVNKWPFELYEMGWGEFDIKIKIELIDESVKPIELVHPLKFYNQPHQSQSSKKPVVSENYDEIIFVNPKPEILEQLLRVDNSPNQVEIFQEPLNNKKNNEDGENDGTKDNINNVGSSMEVEDEDKSLATGSQLNQNLNLNNTNSIISINEKTPMITNIAQYFTKFDDSGIIKELNEKNEFVIQEIEKLKQEIKKKEDDILNLNKEIRKYK
jgi:transcription initiation factor IIF auxiliary subunit